MTPHPDREQEIRARAEAATRGPWALHYERCDCQEDDDHGLYVSRIETGAGPATELRDLPNAEWELMVHAREDVDWLLARVAELEADRDASVAAAVRRTLEDAASEIPDMSPWGVRDWLRARAAAVASPDREEGEETRLANLTIHPAPWRIGHTDQVMPSILDADGHVVAEKVSPEAVEAIVSLAARQQGEDGEQQ